MMFVPISSILFDFPNLVSYTPTMLFFCSIFLCISQNTIVHVYHTLCYISCISLPVQ